MEQLEDLRHRRAARIIARELGVRIDHPGTDRLARALAGLEPCVAVICGGASIPAPGGSYTLINSPAEHPAEPAKRNLGHAEKSPSGR